MATSRTIEIDLLIAGGGIQGLTLLHHYTEAQRGSAILVTRDSLGTGETLHSHGYLHRGYFLPPGEASLIPDFVASFDWWDSWMRGNRISYAETAPVLFDVPEEQYETITRIWKSANLPFEDLTRLPVALQGGSYARPHRRRLVTIHDRLIAPWQIVDKLSEPLQEHLMRGEVVGISLDPRANRIAECAVSTPEGDITIRPRFLVLATGRNTQPLLRRVAVPDGTHPLRVKLQELNLIRDVPMILIRGAALPSLSGWFYLNAPITMMTHPLEDGGRMWVVTLMEGHRTRRGDHEETTAGVDPPGIRKTLRVLREMIPGLSGLSGALRFSSYNGAKIDHPEGLRRWFIGDAGIDNLRFVWPVFWGLAHGASLEVMRELSESPSPVPSTSRKGGGSAASGTRPPTGIEVGEEKRLSRSLEWHGFEEWKGLYRLESQSDLREP